MLGIVRPTGKPAHTDAERERSQQPPNEFVGEIVHVQSRAELLLLVPAHHELDTPVAGHVRIAVVGRERSRRTIAHRFQASLLDARLDQISQYGTCTLGGKALVSLSAPLRAGMAG